MSEYADPRIPFDKRFPDRPQTLDFARLSGAAAQQDAVADMLGVEEALDVDTKSLIYLGGGRLNALLPGMPPKMLATFLAVYFDAFQLGVEFQKRGGHRPEETGVAGEEEGSS